MENATHSEGYLRGHSVPGKEGTVLKLDFLSPTPLEKLHGLLNACLSLERWGGGFPPASPFLSGHGPLWHHTPEPAATVSAQFQLEAAGHGSEQA